MSGVSEVYLCFVIGKNIRNNSGNSHIVGTDQILMSPIELLKGCAGFGGSVGCASDWRPGGRGFNPRQGWQHSFVEIDHEIFSSVIPPFR